MSVQFRTFHEYKYENAVNGIQRVTWGFFKKLVIADNIARVIGQIIMDSSSFGGMTTLFAIFLYSFQLYADFSGYTDIAIGCSQMLNIKLGENFNCPYFSQSITEFWRRWHMSLGNWFREFLFYPLLRSGMMTGIRRKVKPYNKNLAKNLPTVLSLFVFWFFIGLWHGASFSFILYGLYHGLFVIGEYAVENLGGGAKSKQPACYSFLKIILTFAIVTLGYILFAPADILVSKDIVINVTTNLQLHKFRLFLRENQRFLFAIALGLIVLFVIDFVHYNNPETSIRNWINKQSTPARYIIYLACTLTILMLGAYGTEGVNEFAYFRF